MKLTREIFAANQKTWEQACEWAMRMFTKKLAWECRELSDKAWARHRAKLDAWLAGDPVRGAFYELLVRSHGTQRATRH